MEIKFQIPDDKIKNFSEDAKNRLNEITKAYTLEIVSEAEKIEKTFRESGATSEVTETNVFQAIRINKTGRKKKIRITIVRIVADILAFIAGLMFIPEWFVTQQNNQVTLNIWYFILFLTIAAGALTLNIITYNGGE